MGSDASDSERERAVAEWRMRHGLDAEDPILWVAELLEIYVRHRAIPRVATSGQEPSVPVAGWAAVLAVVLAALGGFILGRFWG